jgi:hypothetical protein
VVRPTFAAGTRGVVYILPEVRRPEELFGLQQVPQAVSHAAAWQPPAAH